MTDPGANGDRRHIHPESGILSGEASEQRAQRPEPDAPTEPWTELPTANLDDPTYYDRPLLKEAVWISAVPVYFWAGGASGAAATLAAVAQIADRDGLDGLIKRARWVAAAGGAAGTALLIVDLGKPSRFANMLRVFRPSSPMSVGSWVLAGAAPLAAGSAVLHDAGALGGVADAAGLAIGVLGMPLAGYTSVLLSNTAVPLWQEVRRTLPALFLSSAVISAASVLQMFDLDERELDIVRRYGTAGKVADLVASQAVRRNASRIHQVGSPLHAGLSGALWKASEALIAASLALSMVPGNRGRGRRVVEGLLGTAGSLAMRFAVFHAGKASSRDPRATFRHQRGGHGGTEATGRAAVTGPEDLRAVATRDERAPGRAAVS